MNQKILAGKRVVIYSRVSTNEQKQTGYSLDNQQDQIEKFCRDNGMIIIRSFQEAHSAKDGDRPVFREMYEFVMSNSNKVDYVLVHKWDRLYRNVVSALVMLENVHKKGIIINATSDWKNLDNPIEWFMTLITLGQAELENKQKSDRVKDGNYRANSEGRYISKPPLGYIPGKDSTEKTLIQPHPELAPIVSALLTDYSTGNFSQNDLIKKYKTLGLKLSSSNLSRMLSNILYAGKIKIPAYKGEPEKVIPALHKPLISDSVFKRNQYLLNEKNRIKEKPSTENDNLPLRGKILKCPECNRNLTGYTKTKKSGKQYHYYNCDARLGCSFSCNASEANRLFEERLKQIKPSHEALELFRILLVEKYESTRQTRSQELEKMKQRCLELRNKNRILLDKLLSSTIDDDTYKAFKSQTDSEILELEYRIEQAPQKDESLEKYIDFGLSFLSQLDIAYLQSGVKIKKMILGSILSGNPVFDGEKYRTLEFNPAIALLSNHIKGFRDTDKKKGDNFSTVSPMVQGNRQISNFIMQDVDIILHHAKLVGVAI